MGFGNRVEASSVGFLGAAFHAVGDRVEQSGLADASILVVDDHGSAVMSLVAERDFLAPQIDGRFVTLAMEAERVVFFDAANRFGVEQFVGVLRRREKANPFEIHAEAVDWFHSQGGMNGGVVVVFDPVGELRVERLDRTEVEVADQELVADTAKEAFDFAFRGGVPDGGVTEDAAHAGGDQRDFLAAVDRTVVDIELFGKAAFIKR